MKFWTFSFFLICNVVAMAQSNMELIETSHFNRDSIKAHNIQSVIVFAEMGLDGDFENGILSGKAKEFEFDTSGNVHYKVRSYDDGYYPFAEFGRGSEITYCEYNDRNLEVLYCEENYKGISKYHSTYNEKGNIVLYEVTHEGKSNSAHDKHSFEWKEGEMINSKLLHTENSSNYYVRYDETGRLVEEGNDLLKKASFFFEYGDTIVEEQMFFKSDTCTMTFTYEWLRMYPRDYISYEYRDCGGKLIEEVEVKLDPHGNVTEFTSYDYSVSEEVEEEELYGSESQLRFQVTNTYDYRGLLVKQEFYKLESLTSKKQLVKVYRYVYETTPLLKKFKMGELRQMEIDMNESYGTDD